MREGDQHKTPLWDALQNYCDQGILPFHVPGHKQGRGNPLLKEALGETTMAIDLTCMEGLDNICNPLHAISDAQALAAQAFGAENAFFLVNGTTSGIQGMIMSVCSPGDKLLVPRNAHRAVISGLILGGVQPVYLQPQVDQYFGIAHGITPEQVEWALEQHPDANGVFVINPTYYGVASQLPRIVEIAHRRGVPVIVDEAHGAHLVFHQGLPPSAMEAGADLSAASTHKLTGSLTQSSLLLHQGTLVDPQKVKAVLNLSQTTSPSYILLASLDLARQQMGVRGRHLLNHLLQKASWLRRQIAGIPGLSLLDIPHLRSQGNWQQDPTKVVVNVRNLGMSGQEAESLLRHQYGIQVELSDLYNIILLLSIGDSWEMVQHVVKSLRSVVANCRKGGTRPRFTHALPELPQSLVLPREAFYGQTKVVNLAQAEGEISAEMIMAYPPGIPLICPGERFTAEIVAYIDLLKGEGYSLQGTADPQLREVRVMAKKLVLIQQQHVMGVVGN